MSLPLPALPSENTDPWYGQRTAFDTAVKERLEGPLSPDGLRGQIVAAASELNPDALSDDFIAQSIAADGTATRAQLDARYRVFLPSPGNDVDIMPKIQELYDAGARIIDFQQGAVYLADSAVFLDSPNVRACLTINFNGAIMNVGPNAGKQVTAYSGTAGTRFLFFVNVKRTTAATVPVNESTSATGSFTATVGAGLVVHGGDFRGLGQPVGQLVRVAMALNTSVKFFSGRTSYLAGLYATAGYTDSNTPFDFRMTNPTSLDPNPSIVYQQSNGDALVITAGNSDAKGMICDLRYTRGAAIVGAVGGSMRFFECRDIHIVAAHIEGDEGTRQHAPLRVTRSLVAMRDSELWVPATKKTFPAIEVNDGSGNPESPTDLLLDNVTFVNVYRGDSVADEQSTPEISITAMNLGSIIRARNVWSSTVLVSTTDLWRAGVRVVSSDSAIQAALTAGAAQIATGSWDLKRFNNAWRVSPPDSELVEVIGMVTAPTIDSTASTDQVAGTLVVGDYVYRFAMLDGNNVYGNSTASSTATIPSGRTAARLIVSPRRPGRLAVWRTSPGQSTPDRYAVIGVAGTKIFLYDTGENLNKRPWITSAIPAIPASSGSASVDTLKLNGKAVTVSAT